MAASVKTSGSLSTDGSEQTLATVTDAGVYQMSVDLSDMVDAASPDVVVLRLYGKARSSDTERLAETWQFVGSQGKPLFFSPPLISPHSYRVSIEMTTGSATIPWAIYTV